MMKSIMRIFPLIILHFALYGCDKRTVTINITSEISINWDNVNSTPVYDNHYSDFEDYYAENKCDILDLIDDRSTTQIKSCPKTDYLTKGEVIFLLVDEIESLPLFDLFQIQWDVYSGNCKYPMHLLDFVSNERKTVIDKLRIFLECNDIPR